MTLSAGVRLGPYEILTPLGAGGMGEVYRARDTRLDRSVALKVLPAAFAEDEERLQRFEREARTVASLSDPHICALYDVGQHDGTHYLVMEHLEGQTLAERLKHGPLPLEQVLRFGMQIAEALGKAHRHGIVHRDLKPSNVMLTKGGAKLLDFGLAKLVQGDGKEGALLTNLPTREQALTGEGRLLGTFQYMSPEQIEGKESDTRTDIFALGLLLYEMATGRRAFTGTSQASLMAAILRSEPEPLRQLAPVAPPMLDRVVRACLVKDPDERLQSAHDAAEELRWIAEAAVPPGPSGRGRRERLIFTAAGLVIGAAAALTLRPGEPPAGLGGPIRFSIEPPAGTRLADDRPAVSPDGRTLVFTAVDRAGNAQLWRRSLHDPHAVSFAATGANAYPFWSPDGRFVAFAAKGKLMKVALEGGATETLANVNNFRGGTWSQDGTILFAPASSSGIMQMPASGGTVRPVTALDASRLEYSHRFPQFLSDGRRFLFLVLSPKEDVRGIYLGSIDSKERVRLRGETSAPVPALGSRFLFVREDDLFVLSLNADTNRVDGDARPLVRGAYQVEDAVGLQAVASANGVLAWRGGGSTRWQPSWFDRNGREVARVGPGENNQDFSLAPDGNRIARARRGRSGWSDLWLLDAARGGVTRLTSDATHNQWPIWYPDGRRIVFSSLRGGTWDLYTQDVGRIDAVEPLLRAKGNETAQDISPDGRLLLYSSEGLGSSDLFLLPLGGPANPNPS